MRVKAYLKECWAELWNSDSKAWQLTDRLLFIILPFISLILFVIPRTDTQQGWFNMMVNLAWIIPLVVWLMFLLIITPYRLVCKYHRKHQATIDQLVTVWIAGDKLKTEIYTRRRQITAEDANNRLKQWTQSVADVFLANPNELGQAKLIGLSVENKDAADVALPQDMERNNIITGVYIYLAAQVSKINHIIQDLSEAKG